MLLRGHAPTQVGNFKVKGLGDDDDDDDDDG
jgi:hypothetical protein